MFWILFWNGKFNSKYFNAVIGWRFLNVRKTTCDYYSPQNAKIHVRTLVCKNVTQYIRMPTKLFCVLAAICHSTTFRHKVCVYWCWWCWILCSMSKYPQTHNIRMYKCMSMNAIMCTHWMDCKYANINIHIKLFIYINMAPSFSRFFRFVRHSAHFVSLARIGVFGQSLMQILQFKLKDGYCTLHVHALYAIVCICCIFVRDDWMCDHV